MRRPRITLAGLLGIVALAAVAVAALREPTDVWDAGLFGVTLVTLLISVLLAVHRRGDRRVFWLGCSLFGWTYLVLSLVPAVESRLPTTMALAYLDSKVSGRTVALVCSGSRHESGRSMGWAAGRYALGHRRPRLARAAAHHHPGIIPNSHRASQAA